jgi:hypothetical protein
LPIARRSWNGAGRPGRVDAVAFPTATATATATTTAATTAAATTAAAAAAMMGASCRQGERTTENRYSKTHYQKPADQQTARDRRPEWVAMGGTV